MDIHAVIMAGGRGTRFWPLSRRNRPKQFLPIISQRTMIEETVDRLSPLLPYRRIYTVADAEQTRTIRDLLPGIPEKNLLVEPQGKNTAPSLILATAWVHLRHPRGVVAALPADHLISDVPLFLKKLRAAASAAAAGNHLVTFGIRPTCPSTGYGYIHFSRENPRQISGDLFYEVKEFKEKPGGEQAKAFLADGRHFWNSGMFLWRADVFAAKLKEYAPSFFPFWERMIEALKSDDKAGVSSVFEEMPAISIDYALMEKAGGVLVCEGDFGWSDVGAWSSLFDIWPRDGEGNALKGENVVLDSGDCLVYNPGKLTALVGVRDLVIVETEDTLLICHRDRDQEVRNVIETLKTRSKKEFCDQRVNLKDPLTGEEIK